MGNHWNKRPSGNHVDPNRYPDPGSGLPPRMPIRVPAIAIVLGLIAWTFITYLGYVALDLVLTWLSSSGGAMLQAGKDAGSAIGVGKEVGVAIDSLKSTGLFDQAVSLLKAILKPAAIVIWVLGAIAIIFLPRILGALAAAFGRRSH
jgi:hypothetical protein